MPKSGVEMPIKNLKFMKLTHDQFIFCVAAVIVFVYSFNC